jgi:DNA polymerase III alpha subunit (gram-positive type)
MAIANSDKPFLIYSDIETDSLSATKILQISAIAENGQTFNVHINPGSDLPLQCTNITGLYYYRNNLYKNGRLVPSVSLHRGLRDFRDWILSFQKPVHLVYHNGFSFDAKIIIKIYLKLKIKFPENVLMIHDTLPAFRKKLKEIRDHRLSTLAEHTKVKLTNAHDALADSVALKEICESYSKIQNIDLHEFLNLYAKSVEHLTKIEKDKLEKDARPNGAK